MYYNYTYKWYKKEKAALRFLWIYIINTIFYNYINYTFGLRKSASAPPRGEAREPGMQLLAFH